MSLSPAGAADLDLLLRIYADSRADELAPLVDWTQAQKAAFLRQQFAAQDSHYRRHYPGARFDLILEDGRPIGRLYVHRGDAEIRLMDIALLAGERGRGIGSALIRGLIEESEASGLPLALHVEPRNPARRLYERLGLRVAGEVGPYLYLIRTPRGRPADQLNTAS